MAYSQQVDTIQDEKIYEHEKVLAGAAAPIKKIDSIYQNQILMCVKFDLNCK